MPARRCIMFEDPQRLVQVRIHRIHMRPQTAASCVQAPLCSLIDIRVDEISGSLSHLGGLL
ncbi:Uncharacterized protein DAT39_013970 [Clarias magur]|uniref:Uncharacterized protein n=1 Tax=Clarias magur TaxID=1594786 RepID=A0A8J4UK36_CLAMG|nr:Uncharacterized protein DAT39_013970 [Clarias magur]